ncbi:MAG: hypothetical protein ACI81R_001066, partial [Bradymonadia bacterium]
RLDCFRGIAPLLQHNLRLLVVIPKTGLASDRV